MIHVYLVTEGLIGVGKTSLSRLLAQKYQASLTLEVVEDNPFLGGFYADMERYAFQVQVFFLLSRFKQLQHVTQGDLFHQNHVSDYMFDKDFVFASMNLKDHEFDLYQELYGQLKPKLAHPDLVVYLRAEPEFVKERILKRGREFELDMPLDYLRNLSNHYDRFFETYPGQVLCINAADYDFVGNPEDALKILGEIEEALKCTSQ